MSEQTDSIEPIEPAAPQADGKVAAPGWYPVGPDIQRYWDGEQWTDHTAPLAQQAPPVPQAIMLSDKTGKPIQATTAWIIAIVTLGYMLPWAIAATRGKSNAGAIGWINLLLGWTGVGWIVTLVMACTAHQASAVIVNR